MFQSSLYFPSMSESDADSPRQRQSTLNKPIRERKNTQHGKHYFDFFAEKLPNTNLIWHQTAAAETARTRDTMEPFQPFRIQVSVWLFVFRLEHAQFVLKWKIWRFSSRKNTTSLPKIGKPYFSTIRHVIWARRSLGDSIRVNATINGLLGTTEDLSKFGILVEHVEFQVTFGCWKAQQW